MMALFGMETVALETPLTAESADCTFLVQETPHIMPLTLSSMVLVWPSAAFSAVSGEDV